MNSKDKGNVGISAAIFYFTKLGYTVSIPLTDSQSYDIIVDIDSVLYKVQVKYTSIKATSGSYVLSLRSISGTTKKSYATIKDLDIDYVFVYTAAGDQVLIPITEITNTSSLTLTRDIIKKYSGLDELA